LGLGLASGALTIASMAVAGYDHGLSERLGIAAGAIGLIDMAVGISTSIFTAAKAGKSVAGAAESDLITLGRDMENGRAALNPHQAFGGVFKGFFDHGVVGIDASGARIRGRRLNIVCHGDRTLSQYAEQTVDKYANGVWSHVQNLYKTTPDELLNIDGIRLISCHGGDTGNVASRLAKKLNLPVKAYVGEISGDRFILSQVNNPAFKNYNYVAKPWRFWKRKSLNPATIPYKVAMYNASGELSARYTYGTILGLKKYF
jgi:hypothetical protein